MAKLERIYTVPLGGAYEAVRRKRVPTAVKMLRAFITRHMKAAGERIVISQALNTSLWGRSIQKPPRKVKVRLIKEDGSIRAYLADEKIEEPKKAEKKDEKKAEKREEKKEPAKEQKPAEHKHAKEGEHKHTAAEHKAHEKAPGHAAHKAEHEAPKEAHKHEKNEEHKGHEHAGHKEHEAHKAAHKEGHKKESK